MQQSCSFEKWGSSRRAPTRGHVEQLLRIQSLLSDASGPILATVSRLIGARTRPASAALVPLHLAIFLDGRWNEQVANGHEPTPAFASTVRAPGASRQDGAIRGFINRKLMKRLAAKLAERRGSP